MTCSHSRICLILHDCFLSTERFDNVEVKNQVPATLDKKKKILFSFSSRSGSREGVQHVKVILAFEPGGWWSHL